MTTRTDNLVRLTSFPTEIGAAAVVAALEDVGISAIATGGFTAGFRAEAPGWVQVMVAEDDLERAREVLNATREEMTEIDWSQVDVGEPEEAETEGAPASAGKYSIYGMPLWQMLALLMATMAISAYAFSALRILYELWR